MKIKPKSTEISDGEISTTVDINLTEFAEKGKYIKIFVELLTN